MTEPKYEDSWIAGEIARMFNHEEPPDLLYLTDKLTEYTFMLEKRIILLEKRMFLLEACGVASAEARKIWFEA